MQDHGEIEITGKGVSYTFTWHTYPTVTAPRKPGVYAYAHYHATNGLTVQNHAFLTSENLHVSIGTPVAWSDEDMPTHVFFWVEPDLVKRDRALQDLFSPFSE